MLNTPTRLIGRRLGASRLTSPLLATRWLVAPLLAACWMAPGAPLASGSVPDLPYDDAGLTREQAAAHLLDRLAFGARPGDVERVAAIGLELWLEQQLDGATPDPALERRLARLESLEMSSEEIVATFPAPARVVREALRAGAITEDEAARKNTPEVRAKVKAFGESRGYRRQRVLLGELVTQKLVRAVEAENQLHEVLTDFWFNHFNVSITDNQARIAVLSYERDAIRPHVTGRFLDMLGASARHPAMLLYLDNAQSTADHGVHTTHLARLESAAGDGGARGRFARRALERETKRLSEEQRREEDMEDGLASRPARQRGINENYARELLELHTLGVDGGYTQDDVVAAARALTGWTVRPPGERADKLVQRVERARRAGIDLGFVWDGDYLFQAEAHDAEPKIVLDTYFAAGGGIEEGQAVLYMVAHHPSTAGFVARKMAVRFVGEAASDDLVARLARVFTDTGGDLRAMVVAIVSAPEFWSDASRRAKIKSPFCLTASALRALDARVERPRDLARWLERLGQPLYACVPPTGYPDRNEAWVNAGALLNRMSFGLELAHGRVRGVTFDLEALAGHREPESVEAALEIYASLLMPARDLESTLAVLAPVTRDPDFARKVEEAAPAASAPPVDVLATGDMGAMDVRAMDGEGAMDDDTDILPHDDRVDEPVVDPSQLAATPRALAQVVGLILGSPEFQRH